jgi:hypothetical protein
MRIVLPRRLAAAASAGVAIAVVAATSATASGYLAGQLEGEPRIGPHGEVYQPDGTVLLPGNVFIDFGEQEVTPAQLEDYQLTAEEEGITLAEAIDRYAWQDEFLVVIEQLAAGFPDDYAGARILDDGLAAWIAFRGEVPDLAVDLVGGLPKPVALVGDRGFGEQELLDALEAAHYGVHQRPEVTFAASSFDLETGMISIDAEPAGELGSIEKEQLRQSLQPAPGPNPAITYQVQMVDDLPDYQFEGHMRGGAYLAPEQSRSRSIPGQCTTGFSVRTNSDSARGVATAGHCAASVVRRYYQNHGSTSWSSYGRQNWHVGSRGDVGWYGPHANPLPHFYSGWGAIRLVYANRATAEGKRLWVFGTTSGQRSAIVRKLGNCVGSICRLVATDRSVTQGGDSGGPWYSGNTAIGIHSGTYGGLSQFTPTWGLSTYHGLIVLRA